MKVFAGLILVGALAFSVALIVPGRKAPTEAFAAAPPLTEPVAPEAKAPASEAANIPKVVLDESSTDWVVERFVGNSSAGQQAFFNGPALQVGGVGRPYRITFTTDGTGYFRSKDVGVVKVTPDGVAVLVLNETGKIEGPAEEVAAGNPVWNPIDNSLYLTGPNCIRRLYTRPDGTRWVEVVAGKPGIPGHQDGPAKAATITGFGSLYCTEKGVIYFSDGGIRKLENGTITTVTKAIKGFGAYDEDADIFYYRCPKGPQKCAYSFDLKTGKSTKILGMPKPTWRKEGYPEGSIENRFGKNSDGPALTHASFNSDGPWLYWDRFRKALWFGGPDEDRCRWIKDGWAKTVLTRKQHGLVWLSVIGIDFKGQVYIAGSSNPTGIWQARNIKEVKP